MIGNRAAISKGLFEFLCESVVPSAMDRHALRVLLMSEKNVPGVLL